MIMPGREIHIVCFDVPHPPDYGGVIDIYYKVKSLHELGIKVHLHCYQYGSQCLHYQFQNVVVL